MRIYKARVQISYLGFFISIYLLYLNSLFCAIEKKYQQEITKKYYERVW